jgi:hypothetical protein
MDPDDLSEEGISVAEEGTNEIKEETKEPENNLINENNVDSDDIKIDDINKESEVENNEPLFKGRDPMENELNEFVKPYEPQVKKVNEENFGMYNLLIQGIIYHMDSKYSILLFSRSSQSGLKNTN